MVKVALVVQLVVQIGAKVLAAISTEEAKNSLEGSDAGALTLTVEAILVEERVVAAEEAFPVDEGAEVAHPRRAEAEAVEPVSRGREIMPNHAPRILAGARICY